MRYLEWLGESSKKTWDSCSPGHEHFDVGSGSLISGQSKSTLTTQKSNTGDYTEDCFTKIEQPIPSYRLNQS